MKTRRTFWVLTLLLLIASCATIKSPMHGKFEGEKASLIKSADVNVLFVFKNYSQTVGVDVVPKNRRLPHNFNDMFREALEELSNIGSYNSITMDANFVNNKQKRQNLIRQKKESDFVIEFEIKKQRSFSKYFFGTVASSLSLTLFPVKYSDKYTVNAKVYKADGVILGEYQRSSELKKWVQTLMIFVYPFHHEKKKKEQVFVSSLADIFTQIESERILDYTNVDHVSRTFYGLNEVFVSIDKYRPIEEIHWNRNKLNNWLDKRDIAIVVHFPNDALSTEMAMTAFKMSVQSLDKLTKEKGIVFWVDEQQKHPILLISAQNQIVLKSHLENNNHLKVLLRGMFHL